MMSSDIPNERSSETKAALAAIRFESDEKDRWLRANSFIYRHFSALFNIGFFLIAIGIGGFFWSADRYRIASSAGQLSTMICLGTCWVGILTILISAARSETRTGLGAAARVAAVLGFVAAVAAGLYGLLALAIWIF